MCALAFAQVISRTYYSRVEQSDSSLFSALKYCNKVYVLDLLSTELMSQGRKDP